MWCHRATAVRHGTGPTMCWDAASSCGGPTADVAQLVAHPTCNRAVRGSSPLVGSDVSPGQQPRTTAWTTTRLALRPRSLTDLSLIARERPAEGVAEFSQLDLVNVGVDTLRHDGVVAEPGGDKVHGVAHREHE